MIELLIGMLSNKWVLLALVIFIIIIVIVISTSGSDKEEGFSLNMMKKWVGM